MLGVLAVIGVLICPITSGDTALRSARMMIQDDRGYEKSNKKNMVLKADIKISDEAMKAAGIGWLKRKAMKAALAVAPSSEKGTYVVKGQQIIMTDSDGEKDTLMLSQDGQYLSGKMDGDTPFKLKRQK